MKPAALHKKFHGRPAKAKRSGYVPPKALVALGQAVEIIYASDKKKGGGNGRVQYFRHKFETPVTLCADEKGKKQLYLLGKRLKVTSRGIEN